MYSTQRRPWGARTYWLAGTLVLAFALTACGGSAANNGATTTGGNAAGSTQKHFKVGDQVKVGDTSIVTVNSFKTAQGDEFTKPKSGNMFVVADVTLKNVTNAEQDVSSVLNFNMKDSTGQQYTETYLTDATAPDGKVEAGGLLKGQLAYEVPASQHDYNLSFQADIVSSGQTIWDLHI
jgi:hypothetical protein